MHQVIKTRVGIVGGGPAGMMLGLLLGRLGIDVVVAEKHCDFLRDFRGDTVHPSTLEVMHELGLLSAFLQRPHQSATELNAVIGGRRFAIADFSHLPSVCRYLLLMPQWEFLDFLSAAASAYPTFHLLMDAEFKDLLRCDDRVSGFRLATKQGEVEVACDLVVGADGRQSLVRVKAGLSVEDLGAPIDALWSRLPRLASDPEQLLGHFDRQLIFVMLNRGDYWQCAVVIPKGAFEQVREAGLPAFRRRLRQLVGFLGDRIETLQSWDQVKLLTVRLDRLRQWAAPGVLCIGDAAHAMSPVGGVGINLAIQDAVAAANLLAPSLLGAPPISLEALGRVQRRREFPTKVTQRLQQIIHRQVLQRVLAEGQPLVAPLGVRVLTHAPWFRQLTARVVGLGIRMEHVRTSL